jgi:hypothetical protein
LHTGYSLDAGLFGNTLTPEDAYRFARGEEIKSSTGLPVKLGRPLDFLVVADHSDAMGLAIDIKKGLRSISRKARQISSRIQPASVGTRHSCRAARRPVKRHSN